MKVVYAHQAVQDLVDAYEFLIGRNEIRAAQQLDASFARFVERLAVPHVEGPLQKLRSGAGFRNLPCPPFRVMYTRDEDVLVILRVYRRRPLHE